MARRLMHYVLLILVVLVLFALFLRWREPSMIYYPTRDIDDTPDRHGWPHEDVWLTTADNLRIHGWFIPAGRPLPSSPFSLLFLHGNAGNISHRFEKLAIFRDLGLDVLIIDYRGYGRSAGAPNEAGTYLDAAAACSYLLNTEHRLPAVALRQAQGHEPSRLARRSAKAGTPNTLILYGESLGSAVAVELATRVSVGGVIIEEPFTSIADVGQKMFPFMPVRWIVRNKYDTLSKIARINVPLLIFHSRDDEYFPIRHAHRLLAAAKDPKQLVELRGSHNDAFLASADRYRQGLREFLASPQP